MPEFTRRESHQGHHETELQALFNLSSVNMRLLKPADPQRALHFKFLAVIVTIRGQFCRRSFEYCGDILCDGWPSESLQSNFCASVNVNVFPNVCVWNSHEVRLRASLPFPLMRFGSFFIEPRSLGFGFLVGAAAGGAATVVCVRRDLLPKQRTPLPHHSDRCTRVPFSPGRAQTGRSSPT